MTSVRPEPEDSRKRSCHSHPAPDRAACGGSPHDSELLAEARDILDVDHVATVAEGIERLATTMVSAVLLDLSLPEARDLTALDELRRVARASRS